MSAPALLAQYGATQVAAGGGWTPASLPNLLGWWDASDAASITSSGGAVSAWADKGVNGFTLAQATGGLKPTTGTRTLNGLNVLDFDGANDLLFNSTITDTKPTTFFLVIRLDTAGDNQYVTDAGPTGTDRNAFASGVNAGGQIGIYAGASGPNGGATPTTANQWTLTFNGASSSIRKDGVSVGSGDAGANNLGGLTLGCRYSGTNPMDGIIAELFISSIATTGADRTSAETYLKTKWGTP